MTVNKEFYVTFGHKYHHDPHPAGEWVHPDGYLTIEAPDYAIAREKAFEITDGKFAFMYEKQPGIDFFPLGETMRVTA